MKFGISILSIVPMRSEISDKSEMVSQILFGEIYKIIEQRKKFSKVRLSHDKYEGWICNKQVNEIDEETFKSFLSNKKNYTTDILDIIRSESLQTIVLGSILPKLDQKKFTIGSKTYNFEISKKVPRLLF